MSGWVTGHYRAEHLGEAEYTVCCVDSLLVIELSRRYLDASAASSAFAALPTAQILVLPTVACGVDTPAFIWESYVLYSLGTLLQSVPKFLSEKNVCEGYQEHYASVEENCSLTLSFGLCFKQHRCKPSSISFLFLAAPIASADV